MRLLVIVVLVFLIGCVSCIREEVGEHIQYIQPGDALPEFMVEMNDGTILDWDSLRGKVSVLVFFHTSCSDCQRELPVVQTLPYSAQSDRKVYSLFSEEGVPLVYVSDTACNVRYLFTDNPIASFEDLYQAVSSLSGD